MFGNYTISETCSEQNHVCEVDYNLDPVDYFLEDESSYMRNSFLYMISCMALICFNGTLFHCLDNRFTNENNSIVPSGIGNAITEDEFLAEAAFSLGAASKI